MEYAEARGELEARLKEVEFRQTALEGWKLHTEVRQKHWRKSLQENRWAQERQKQSEAKLAEACRSHAKAMRKLGVHGTLALQAGQAVGEWAVAQKRLRAVLQNCAVEERHLREAALQLSLEERRLLYLEKSLQQSQAQWEQTVLKLRRHELELTDALTALGNGAKPRLGHLASRGALGIVLASWPLRQADVGLLKGQLYPPVFGFLEKPFGPVLNPKSNTVVFHKGIQICAARGARLRAVAAGKVAFAGKRKGFGKLVILEHGGGFHSVVANLEERGVEEGEEVAQGSWLGTLGEGEGASPTACVYFEIRQEGEAQNPTEWFVVGSLRGGE